MAQAEEETRSRSAIVIKPGGRYVGKQHLDVGAVLAEVVLLFVLLPVTKGECLHQRLVVSLVCLVNGSVGLLAL